MQLPSRGYSDQQVWKWRNPPVSFPWSPQAYLGQPELPWEQGDPHSNRGCPLVVE